MNKLVTPLFLRQGLTSNRHNERIVNALVLVLIKAVCYIVAASFDVHDSAYSDILEQYLPLLLAASNKVSKRLQNFWLHSDFIYKLTGNKRELDQIIQQLVALSKLVWYCAIYLP